MNTVRVAAGEPFAVYDHAAGENESTRPVCVVQRAQKCRGAEIVLRDVIGHIGEVDTESDHGRLMADRVGTAHDC